MKSSRTRYAILALLRIRPMSGYEIREFCRTRLRAFWNESFGQIYPTLARLAAEGLIRSTDRRQNPRATYYEVTDRGRAALHEWMHEPPAPRVVRDETLLKLFSAGATTPDVLLEHVTNARRQARAELETLGSAARELEAGAAGHPDSPYWRLILRAGERIVSARLDWCAEAEAVLRERARAMEDENHD